MAVTDVDTDAVLAVLQPIWHKIPETASRLRGRIELVLDWAKARGFRNGDNPARWRGHLQSLLPPKSKLHSTKHHAAVPFTEIAQFMVLLRENTSVSARALEFLVLTATRTSEVLNATWDEIDFADRSWAVPSQRMKSGREHRVPLGPRATVILKALKKLSQGPFIFPGQKTEKPLSSMSMAMLLRDLGYGDFTVHGFRSTFRDWAAEQTNFSREVAEAALAHVVSDKVEAAYRRGDLFAKRRNLLAAWEAFCGCKPQKKRRRKAAASVRRT
jgi:integrase